MTETLDTPLFALFALVCVAETLKMVAEDPDSDYQIQDPNKLRKFAKLYEIETDGKDDRVLAKEVAEAALYQFGRQEGHVQMTKAAPAARQKLWEELDVVPRDVPDRNDEQRDRERERRVHERLQPRHLQSAQPEAAANGKRIEVSLLVLHRGPPA